MAERINGVSWSSLDFVSGKAKLVIDPEEAKKALKDDISTWRPEASFGRQIAKDILTELDNVLQKRA